jgi:hypothetical protein
MNILSREGVLPNSPPKLGGVPFARFSANGGVVPQETTPSAPLKVASQHFLDGAATPPNLGGELRAPATFRQRALSPGVAILLLIAIAVTAAGQGSQSPALNDPIALLARQLERGEVKLDYSTNGWGYLPSLLTHLGINIDSQVLVFSKTSFQLTKITPKTPRALFFNDSVAVGSVQDGKVFEFTSLDPSQGIIFYTMDVQKNETPRFERRFGECLNCHGPANGLVVSSVFPSADGTPFVTGTFFEGIDHRTPIENRWGGWYVSGTHGSVRHMGNAIAPDPDRPFDLQQESTQNLTSLESKLDTSKYLTSTSDIVALMTLEHQAHMTNLITGVSQQFRRASANGTMEKSKNSLDRALDQLVEYMLFTDEAPLRDPVKGVSTFTNTFPQRGPRDKHGRSLRDFDLHERLFRYPLSYMIYSEIFDAMPAVARDRVYQRLYDVLTGKDQSPKWSNISATDRRAMLDILVDTKPNLPDYWTLDSLSLGSR